MNARDKADDFLNVITGQESIKTEVTHKLTTEWKTFFIVVASFAAVQILKRIISTNNS